jgi:hypothetical protein
MAWLVIYTHFPLGYSIANDKTKDINDAIACLKHISQPKL